MLFDAFAHLMPRETMQYMQLKTMHKLSPPMTLQTWLWHTDQGQSLFAQTFEAAGTAQSLVRHLLAASLHLCRAPASSTKSGEAKLQLYTCRLNMHHALSHAASSLGSQLLMHKQISVIIYAAYEHAQRISVLLTLLSCTDHR